MNAEPHVRPGYPAAPLRAESEKDGEKANVFPYAFWRRRRSSSSSRRRRSIDSALATGRSSRFALSSSDSSLAAKATGAIAPSTKIPFWRSVLASRSSSVPAPTMSAAPRNDPAFATEPVTFPAELATLVSTAASRRIPYAVASAVPAVSESAPLSAGTAERRAANQDAAIRLEPSYDGVPVRRVVSAENVGESRRRLKCSWVWHD